MSLYGRFSGYRSVKIALAEPFSGEIRASYNLCSFQSDSRTILIWKILSEKDVAGVIYALTTKCMYEFESLCWRIFAMLHAFVQFYCKI